MQRKRGTIPHGAPGFSILELLVALIIIGILVATLIPIVSNRAAEARLRAAEQDMKRLGDALTYVAIDTGYYVRLFMLNDSVGGDSPPVAFDRPKLAFDYIDGVQDYDSAASPGWHQRQDQLFIDPKSGDLVDTVTGNRLLDDLQDDEEKFNWNGAYANWQRDSNRYLGDIDAEPDGIPDDPWGNNYLLFTQLGMIVEPDGVLVQNTDFPVGGTPTLGGPYECEVFGRFALLSLGPNGVPGSPPATDILGDGDDIVYFFGQ